MPTMAANGNAPRMSDFCVGSNFSPERYPKTSGNQAPQMKSSRTIMKNNRPRAEGAEGEEDMGTVVCGRGAAQSEFLTEPCRAGSAPADSLGPEAQPSGRGGRS